MLQGRSYYFKLGTQMATATIAPLKHKVNVNTLEHLAAKKLELNDIGVCGIALDRPVVFEPYRENRDLGGFILIDRSRTRLWARAFCTLRCAGPRTFIGRPLTSTNSREPRSTHKSRVSSGLLDCRAQANRPLPTSLRSNCMLGLPHLSPRRRQRAARVEQGSRLYRCGSRGEYPSSRGSCAPYGGRRADRPRVVHFAIPHRATHGTRACAARRVRRSVR